MTNLRVPPQNLEAEKAVLGSIMLRPEALYEISDILSPESFYANKHALIYQTILDLSGKSEPIDLLTISNALKEKKKLEAIGGSSYLAELANFVPASTNAPHYATIVQKNFILRRLIGASEEISELGFNQKETEIEEVLDQAEKKIYDISLSPKSKKILHLKDTLEEAWERLERLHGSKNELRGAPTGFADLDNILSGLQKQDLIILAARPSVGKTALALDIARLSATIHNVPTLIFSLEMSAGQLVDRMLSAESKVNAWNLRTGRLSAEADFSRIRDSLDRLSKAPIYIDDKPANNIMNMRRMARKLKAEKGLGLVIVDYLQLMATSKNYDSMVNQVTEISRSLKSLAREMEVPVLALSQLSRAIESRGGKPKLSDLRDSGCLAGDTLICRADTGESLPIKDLVSHKNIPIFSIDQEYKLRKVIASKIFSSGRKRIFELKTRSGRIIKASANHPFLTFDGWQRLDGLGEGDRIALPRHLLVDSKSSTLSKNEIILLAHLLGDGCVLPRQPIHYTSADLENLTAVENAAQELFGIKARRVKQKNWWHSYLKAPFRLARGRRHPIMLWYERLGIKPCRAPEKIIPQAFYSLPDNDIRLFLHHLWATDGNISWKKLKGRKPAAAIYYASTSPKLAEGVQHLLLRLGIWSTIRKVLQGPHRPNFQVHVQSAPIQLNFLKQVGSFGERGKISQSIIKALEKIAPIPNTDTIPRAIWNLFIDPARKNANLSWRELSKSLDISYNGTALMATGLSRERLGKLADTLKSDELTHLAESDIYWDEVSSITPLGLEEVFDMTVPGSHNFVAGDIIVHNSIEQDADVVMFIHREDRYKEESEKTNIAEILIEKHRNGPTGRVELYFDEKRTTFLPLEKGNLSDIAATMDRNEE